MDIDKEPHLQLEAAWSLVNISAGTNLQTRCVIDKGAIPRFVKLLKSNNTILAEQAIWAIGNISGDSSEFRDIILSYGGLHPLINVIRRAKEEKDDGIVKQGIWALSNLCRGKPEPKLKDIKDAMPTFSRAIQEEYDLEVLSDATWATLHISSAEYAPLIQLVETGIVPSLIRNIDNPYLNILVPTLRILGNILSCEEDGPTNIVLQNPNFIKKLHKLIFHEKKAVRREACWALSNIAAGEPEHIDLIINYPKIVHQIIKIVLSDNPEVKKEAGWILSNATSNADKDQIKKMVKLGILDCLGTLVKEEDENADMIKIGLEGLENMLRQGKEIASQEGTENLLLIEMESKGVITRIEKLQEHKNSDIYEKALAIIEEHYVLEDFF